MRSQLRKAEGKLTVWMTTQAPHAIRTVIALVAGHVGLSEERVRVISPDIGGGFGGKVPVYPGYVIAIAASFLIGKPVKWIEDRSENLQVDSFARDYHMTVELASTKEGKMTGLANQDLGRSWLHGCGSESFQVSFRTLLNCNGFLRYPDSLHRDGRSLYKQATGRSRLSLFFPSDGSCACN